MHLERVNWNVCQPHNFCDISNVCVTSSRQPLDHQQVLTGFKTVWGREDGVNWAPYAARLALLWWEQGGFLPFRGRILPIAGGTGCARKGAVWEHRGVVRCLWGGNNHVDTQGCLHLSGSYRGGLCSRISQGEAAAAFLAEHWVSAEKVLSTVAFLMRPFPDLFLLVPADFSFLVCRHSVRKEFPCGDWVLGRRGRKKLKFLLSWIGVMAFLGWQLSTA